MGRFDAWKPHPEKKVAVVGFATTRDFAPFNDESFEVWGLNHLYQHIPRFTRWFEVHSMQELGKDMFRPGVGMQWSADHLKWLKSQPPGRPIYMVKHDPEIPASVPYPIHEVNAFMSERFGVEPNYQTSTISEMVSLAIMEGFGEIHVYGVDMVLAEEYVAQRACVEGYLQLARGAGIKVFVPTISALFKASYVYGYSLPPEPGAYAPMLKFFRQQAAQIDEQVSRAAGAHNSGVGAKNLLQAVIAWLEHGSRGGSFDIAQGATGAEHVIPPPPDPSDLPKERVVRVEVKVPTSLGERLERRVAEEVQRVVAEEVASQGASPGPGSS